MAERIRIYTRTTGYIQAEVLTIKNPRTAEAVLKALPITSTANRWGDEIYFTTPTRVGEENSQQEAEVGDIAYWPPGNALCIFFGRTPASIGVEPRAASPVNVLGRVLERVTDFRKVKSGEEIRVDRVKQLLSRFDMRWSDTNYRKEIRIAISLSSRN